MTAMEPRVEILTLISTCKIGRLYSSTADATATNRIFVISEINAPGNKLYPNSYAPRARLWFEKEPDRYILDAFHTGHYEHPTSFYARLDQYVEFLANQATLEIFCPGAKVGDFATVRTDPQLTTEAGGYIQVSIVAENTAKIWIRSHKTGGANLHHDIYVTVFPKDIFDDPIGASQVHFLSGSDVTTDKSPLVDANGFVTSGGTAKSMNASGRKYNYVAFFG